MEAHGRADPAATAALAEELRPRFDGSGRARSTQVAYRRISAETGQFLGWSVARRNRKTLPTAQSPAPAATRTRSLKLRRECAAWIDAAAIEVNQVWNWCRKVGAKTARPFVGPPRQLTGFDSWAACDSSRSASD